MGTLSTPRRPVVALLGALAAVVLLAAGCGSGDSDDEASEASAESTTSSTGVNVTENDTIVIDDFTFGDGTTPTEVEEGTILTWQNDDSVRHTVTSVREDLFSSEAIQPGDTFQRQFLLPGEFDYFCNIHPERMSGTIIVTPAEG